MIEGDDDSVLEDWRRQGTCGACVHFRSDFGEPPVLYGHCKMYTRMGARTSSDSTCGEFRPLPGFDEKIVLSTPEVIAANRATPSRPSRSEPARRRTSSGSGIRVVRRRYDADGAPRERDTRVLDDDIVAALTGEEGGSVDRDTLREVLLEVIEQFIGVEDVEIGKKWEGGVMQLQPEDTSLKPYEMPIETFFHKIVMLRENLRVLESKVNRHPNLDDDDRVELQQYVTKCYGTLTSFNVLFKNREDGFSTK
ncbi:MAG: hypothetical protein CVU56_05240 [Deltaproteobacteria bacterium HGW-Deltaproteobacteria-14]|jgi:hypothetical protein|nr:MAG: hypothetical protein CVU56_05240 [Deltaproteobacteria bacterium HGW-Deltaproteobacteria-14]